MFKLFKSNAFFAKVIDKLRNSTPIYDIFLYICTRKLSVNIKNQ